MEPPGVLAPEGIEFPSVIEVRAAYPGEPIRESTLEADALWDLLAETHLAAGDPASALAIAEEVIATWDPPPDRAFATRDRARQAIANARPDARP